MKKILYVNLLLTLSAFADEEIITNSEEILNKTEQVAQIVGQNHYEPNYFSMILGLLLVVAMIYITGYLYQKLTKVNIKNEDLFLNKAQVISTTSIGQGRNLHVVKIGESACLIGSTQNNITFIKDIELVGVDKRENVDNGKNC